MHIRPKALYNLLRFNWLKDPGLNVEPWEVEEARSLELTTLLNRLAALGIVLDEKRFLELAEEVDSPEALVELVWTEEEDDVGAEKAYLLLFELWRRLLPHKKSLSLFCDELDHRIFLYIQDHRFEEMDEILVRLEDVLDSYVDSGASPKKILKTISEGCAYDLEGFLFEYILDLIDSGEELTASELIDGFYEYAGDVKKFEFLRICLFAEVDPLETARLLTELVKSLQGRAHLDLILSIATFLVPFGQDTLFRTCIDKALGWIQTEGEFLEVAALVSEYFLCLDQDSKKVAVDALIKQREGLDPEKPLDAQEDALEALKQILLS